ncbi:ABC transporter permease [Natronomonas marina]|jgi:peptide/nickel transport system permease protein|uniref:ABC transporter permease n=1 Tax=Natronomonas marina TaxID=2961939 RepID=UPI0020C940EC|nr:ABC transporter permease [Natronomonas marina]
MSRTRYFLARTVQTIFLLWLAMTVLFVLFRMMPGDYADLMLWQGASPETVDQFREAWGLNDPLYVQYWNYLTNFLTLEYGFSTQSQRPVWDAVKLRIFNSFILIAPALTVAYVLGSVIGAIMGSNRGSKLEKYGFIPALMTGTSPIFFLGILGIIVFAGWFDLLPTSGIRSPGTTYPDSAPWWAHYVTGEFVRHYILPFSVIVIKYLYLPLLIMRTSSVEVRNQDFFFYHRVTGVPGWKRTKHLAKHASLPVITLYPISLAASMGGLVLLEVVFNWPGMGRALIQAVLARDLPVIQFVFFLIAAFVIIGNYLVDIMYGVIDPRVSVES